MITGDKVIELFCMADDFCKFFDRMVAKYTFKSAVKRSYHRETTLSKAEIMLIIILFHNSGYRCLKHFYLNEVCVNLRHLFPQAVSYNRFMELEKEAVIDNKPYNPRQLSHINDNCVERNKNYPTVNTLIYKSPTIFATFQFPLCRYASSVPSGTCKVIPVLLKMGGTTCGT